MSFFEEALDVQNILHCIGEGVSIFAAWNTTQGTFGDGAGFWLMRRSRGQTQVYRSCNNSIGIYFSTEEHLIRQSSQFLFNPG
jgi:hypothetical protein